MLPRPDRPPTPAASRTRRLPRIVGLVLAGVLVLLLLARIAAPLVIKGAINRRLEGIPGYSGSVVSVNLNLWRGAYGIGGMKIVKRGGQVSEPFFSAGKIDFSIAARELFHGRFVSQIYMKDARLNFLRGPSEESSQLNTDSRWQDVVHDLFPIDITFLDIKGGVLRFVDTTQTPRVDVSIHDLSVRATGLRNRPTDARDPLPARVSVSGVVMGNGQLRLYAKLEPLADQPHFELNLELKRISLAALNDFLEAYASVNVSQGQLDVFAQVAMRDGKYEGYVKPFIKDVHFKDLNDKETTLGERVWKNTVAAVANVTKNKDTKQIASRIPFSGNVGNLDIRMWKSIENGLHHGLVRALSRGFEGTTHPDGPPAADDREPDIGAPKDADAVPPK